VRAYFSLSLWERPYQGVRAYFSLSLWERLYQGVRVSQT